MLHDDIDTDLLTHRCTPPLSKELLPATSSRGNNQQEDVERYVMPALYSWVITYA